MIRNKQLVIWTLVCVCVVSVPTIASAEWYNPMSWMGSSSKKKSKGPSTIQKINNGTKDFFTTTADYMNPFNDGDDHKKKRYTYNGGYRSSKKQEDSSWFGNWFTSEPDPGPPQTVSDFLDLERAKF
ncbi:hypothetical protein [Bremerella alba]|uniref:Uncharacterized protein n=1 Tax=Bremerella alba TaxID=980252 RepID=A0A7V8V591_9BACT|nr:hypothetical protein [Bremerella alba]MBA2115081.1 hypothetical protein [Bremerella alba]